MLRAASTEMAVSRYALVAATAACAAAAPAVSSNVKYAIVLMFENRAFDHFLGHLGLTDPRIDGEDQGAPPRPRLRSRVKCAIRRRV